MTQSGISGVWTTKGSQWPLSYPKNNTVLIPFNWAMYTQRANAASVDMGEWGLNNLPYSNYDTDNFAIAAQDDILFYTYQYRVGQVCWGFLLHNSIGAEAGLPDALVCWPVGLLV